MTTEPCVDAAAHRVSQLLNRHIGLRSEPSLRGRLERCIRDGAAVAGRSADEYVDSLIPGGPALQSLINRVTVQETAFFRHPEHFDLLGRILPDLQPPVTIWSAACSNGQEAFSLAMLMEEHSIQGSIIASDLSTAALVRTAAARYTEREITGLTPHRIARHLIRSGDDWLVNEPVRARVHTLEHNLLAPVPHQVRHCQVIFCRNVLIYFSPQHARAFLDRVADDLPAARLFLGAAETIWQLSDRFDTIRTGDTFSYRRRADLPRSGDSGIGSRGRSAGRAAPTATRHAAVATPSLAPAAGADAPRGGRPRTLRPAARRPQPAPAPTDVVIPLSAVLGRAGQEASAAGDSVAAVVAFRKSAYLAPHDPLAHLHLGLALETVGDHPSAQRAYAAARHALVGTDPSHTPNAIEGYTAADLMRLIDHKQQSVKP